MQLKKIIFNKIQIVLSIFIFFTVSKTSNARETDEVPQESPGFIGNFALPYSQQLGPLISFGQNVISKGQTILSLTAGSFLGNNNSYTALVPNVIYGITNKVSILVTFPIAAENQIGSAHSAGLQDIITQFEYALWYKDTRTSTSMLTILANVSYPTGSYKADPPLGLGSPSFFYWDNI